MRRDSPGALSTPFKIVLGMGDHSLSLSLTAMSVLYVFYLTEYAGLRPALAGSVLLVGRIVDAVTDPLMGRVSDLTRTRSGRRRPYLLYGALPYVASFVVLWTDPGLESQAGKFAYYSAAYIAYSLCVTIVAVPYLALLPEIVPGYDERNSLGAWRSGLSMLGTLIAAAGFRPLAAALGGGTEGFLAASGVFAVWMLWPWVAIYSCTTEREDRPPESFSFVEGMRVLLAHRSYRSLTALYLSGRIAMDLTGLILVFYFQYWIRRPGDFEIMFLLFLVVAVGVLPVWMRVARRLEKRTIFAAGACWWAAVQMALFTATPDWPRAAVIGFAALAAVGYGIVDLVPWSMLGDVVDEDELATGERREGVYSGVFGFLRKLAGALGVWLAGVFLDLAGFTPGVEQTENVREAIRFLTVVLPPFFLLLAVGFSRRYPIGRARHREILDALDLRRRGESHGS